MTGAPTFVDDAAGPRLAWIRDHRPQLERVPLPGSGGTVERLRSLAGLGALDGALARLAEGHLDAVAILHELGRTGDGLWGVWAAQPAALTATEAGGRWRLHGRKPWCSGAAGLDHALVTATTDRGGVLLFALDVGAAHFEDDWQPIGMRASDSRTAVVDTVVDAPLGPAGCYVERAGFWHGGIGVAACWHGLARRLAHDIWVAGTERDDTLLRAEAGAAAALVAAGAALLGSAGRQIDERPHDVATARLRARTVRAGVEQLARQVLQRSVAVQGAGALCFAPDHARAVADLTVYLGQFHHGGDVLDLGGQPDDDWWPPCGSST